MEAADPEYEREAARFVLSRLTANGEIEGDLRWLLDYLLRRVEYLEERAEVTSRTAVVCGSELKVLVRCLRETADVIEEERKTAE